MSKNKPSSSVKTSLIIGTAIGFFAVFLAYFNLLGNSERSFYDLRFSLRGEEPPANDILIVGVTESCLKVLGRWPWDRQVHARLLDLLTEGDAKVIGMDFIFAEPSSEPGMDSALIEASERSSPVVYAADAQPGRGSIDGFLRPLSLTLPLPELLDNAYSGYINVTPDIDGILRRSIIWMEHRGEPITAFSVVIWAISQGLEFDDLNSHLKNNFEPGQTELTLGNFTYPLDSGGRTPINFSGGPGNFPVLPYHLVLDDAYELSTFKDKVILVGYFAPGLGDYYFTPFYKDRPMYGIEVNANIIHMLTKAGPINNLPLWLNLVLVFMFSLLSMLLYRALHPIWGFGGFLFLAAGFFLITMLLFIRNSLYVESIYLLFGLLVGYISSLGYRYITEQKDRQRIARLFGRYVAPQVVDEILSVGEENLKLGGTRRQITLLFVDIRGFTPLSEKLPPEEVVAILNQYFDKITRCIFENQGTIDKFMGDAVMALFNAPLLLEDHTFWALKAAKEIKEQGLELQRKVIDMSGVSLSFGIGINTGDAVVGNIGTMNRMEYTAIGDTVNLAARLESNAEPGQVLVSEAVYREVQGRIPLEYVGKITVKGKSKPVVVYQLAEDS